MQLSVLWASLSMLSLVGLLALELRVSDDDALGKLFKVKTDTKLTLDATIKSLNDATTIRELTNISF